jgi:hypothetical protein
MESSGYYPLKPSLSRKETIQSATILALQRLLGKEKKENIIEFPPCLRQKKGLQIAIGGSRPFGKTHHTHPGRQTLKTLLHAPDSRLTIPPVYKDIPGQVKGITEEGHSENFLFNDPTKLNAKSGYQTRVAKSMKWAQYLVRVKQCFQNLLLTEKKTFFKRFRTSIRGVRFAR